MVKDENKFNFDKDERVLCYHGPFIYEAKILKREKKEQDAEDQEGNQYFVHYKGWKQTWDEWITEDRVLKYTDANLQKQKQLKEMNSKRKPSRASSNANISSLHDGTESRSRKRNRDSSTDKVRIEDEAIRPEFRITIPDTLKVLLVDDWENVTKNKLTLTIPRDITVNKILDDFKESCTIKDQVLEEFLLGIKLYFNKNIYPKLLYRLEREQHEQVCADKEPSSIYGAEHFLRLFVELPNLVSETNMDAESLHEVKDLIDELLKFVQDHEKEYLTNDYQHSHAK